jgi:FixJ family two-component response regulator
MNQPRVLIVDDDLALLQALPEALRLRMGEVIVDTADSAAAALDRIAGHDYDAIVSDIKMPGMDGLALLAEIRARRPETPTLLITGHGEYSLAIEALRGGAYDLIQKPIDRDYFLAALRRAIQMGELNRRRRQLLDHLEKQAVRVGEELHHEILNTLCGYLATAIDEQDYGEAKRRLDDLVTDLRRIMNDLCAMDLEAEGLLPVLRRRLDHAGVAMRRRARPCTVEFDCPADITDETILQSLRNGAHLVLLYRIVSEAIINVRKHSRATRVGVTVRSPQLRVVEIAVWDNGVGNGGPFVDSVDSVGMALMRRRAEEIGADIECRRTLPEGGTTVIIRLGQHGPVTDAVLLGWGQGQPRPYEWRHY